MSKKRTKVIKIYREDKLALENKALLEKLAVLEAQFTSVSTSETKLKEQVTELEKKIGSMKREREMIDQAMAMLKEKVSSLSAQRSESPERNSSNRGHSVKSIGGIDETIYKKKEEEFKEKLAALEAKYEKLIKERDLIVADLDRKVDQIVSLRGDCTKFKQGHNKAVKEKEKMKELLQEINKNFIQQGIVLEETK